MPVYNFPAASRIKAVIDKHSYDENKFVASQIFSLDTDRFNDSPDLIKWDVIEQPTGYTNLTAMDADPQLVQQRAISTKTARPLFFKDCIAIPESQLTLMRRPGSDVRDATDMVLRASAQLNDRAKTLVEMACAQALSGSLNIGGFTYDYDFDASHLPVCGTTSGYGPAWTTVASATPIEDLRKAAATLNGSGATEIEVIASREALAKMVATNEVKDLLKQSNVVLNLSPENFALQIPSIVGSGISRVIVADQYYRDASGAAVSFFADNQVYLVGRAMGQEVGVFASTPSIYNGGVDGARGGFFLQIIDKTEDPKPQILVVGGIYGLPVIFRPDMITALTISA